MKEKIEFLYKAIEDIQGSIRSVDVKLGILYAVLFTPLYTINKIQPAMSKVWSQSHWGDVLIIVVVATWGMAISTILTGLIAAANPAKHVSGGGAASGIFYGAGLFSMRFFDALGGAHCPSSRTLDQEIAALPQDDTSILRELTYEKMKLTYIRDIKIHRSKLCIFATGAWLVVSLITYGSYLRLH